MLVSVHELQKKFPNPKQVVDHVMKPVVDVDNSMTPQLTYLSLLKGRLVRATLHFHWPVTFHVAGQTDNIKGATLNAYLSACEVLVVRTSAKLACSGQHFCVHVIRHLKTVSALPHTCIRHLKTVHI